MEEYKSIGSYFQLELRSKKDNYFYSDAIFLNTGRNALEYIIKVLGIKKLLLPLYLCDALYIPLKRTNISYEFYSLDSQLNPIFDYKEIEEKEYFFYINYFGIKNQTVNELSRYVTNLIIDNSQSFYSKPVNQVPTFYSLRKFFGVPDGAVLANVPDKLKLGQDNSSDRMEHLIVRLENEVEKGYEKYTNVESQFDNVPLLKMSEITKKIFTSIGFEAYRIRRNSNFDYLHSVFKNKNKLIVQSFDGPLVYPLYIERGQFIKKELIKNRVFVPTYWPNVLQNSNIESREFDFANNIVSIPVDQRYNPEILMKAVEIIKLNL